MGDFLKKTGEFFNKTRLDVNLALLPLRAKWTSWGTHAWETHWMVNNLLVKNRGNPDACAKITAAAIKPNVLAVTVKKNAWAAHSIVRDLVGPLQSDPGAYADVALAATKPWILIEMARQSVGETHSMVKNLLEANKKDVNGCAAISMAAMVPSVLTAMTESDPTATCNVITDLLDRNREDSTVCQMIVNRVRYDKAVWGRLTKFKAGQEWGEKFLKRAAGIVPANGNDKAEVDSQSAAGNNCVMTLLPGETLTVTRNGVTVRFNAVGGVEFDEGERKFTFVDTSSSPISNTKPSSQGNSAPILG